MDDLDDIPETTVLLLGDPGVGKSTFLSRLTLAPTDNLPPNTRPTPLRDLDQPFPFTIALSSPVPGLPTRRQLLSFYDTASPTNYTLLLPSLIILCYDVSAPASLYACRKKWYDLVHRHFLPRTPGDALPVLLLGLKRDKRGASGERTAEEMKALVHPQEGLRVAQMMRCERYMECSALTGELVRECMEDVGRVAVAKEGGDVGGGGGCGVM